MIENSSSVVGLIWCVVFGSAALGAPLAAGGCAIVALAAHGLRKLGVLAEPADGFCLWCGTEEHRETRVS